MASVNMAVIVGYVGDNPKVNMTQTGRKVAGITVATTEKGYTAQSGVTYPDKTEWHQIVLWGRLAEVVEKSCIREVWCMYKESCVHGRMIKMALHATRPKSKLKFYKCLTEAQMQAILHQ